MYFYINLVPLEAVGTCSSCLLWGNSAVSHEEGAIHSMVFKETNKKLVQLSHLAKVTCEELGAARELH